MADVLVIRKSDKTIHIVPVDQEAFYKAQNNRLPINERMNLEVMDEKTAIALGGYDKNYKGAAEANASLKEKDAKIAELEEKLAALQSSGKPEETAVEKIARINAAESADEVIAILGTDDRSTVNTAAEKKIASFQK